MSQKVEKVQKGGGGISIRNQIVHNSKCGLFDKMGGGHIFILFPNVNADFEYFSWTELVLKWFLGHSKCFKIMLLLLRGVSKMQKEARLSDFDKVSAGISGFWLVHTFWMLTLIGIVKTEQVLWFWMYRLFVYYFAPCFLTQAYKLLSQAGTCVVPEQ